MKIAIQVSNLKKQYKSHAVLKGLNFEVVQGEIFGLLGVNGAGKTTTLECIEKLRDYDSGTILVNGKMGIQLQSASLPSHIKPMEAVKLFSKWSNAPLDQSMLQSLGIFEIEKNQYLNLSTGQKRRLHLALALVNNPDIIFLDEPTAGLDVEGKIELHNQIYKLKEQGKTIILASHDMSEVEALCDRIAILRNGEIGFLGTVEELTLKIGRSCAIYLKTDQGEETLESNNIRETLLTKLEEFKRLGVNVYDIKIDRGTLEQHFIRLSKGDN